MQRSQNAYAGFTERRPELSLIQESLSKLEEWFDENGLQGWDPYDAMNSSLIRRITMGKPIAELIAIHVMKELPVNTRLILGVSKSFDAKGIALVAQSLALLYAYDGNRAHKEKLLECIGILKKRTLKDEYGYHCWASHDFPFRGADLARLDSSTPDTIGTVEALRAFVAASRAMNDCSLLEYAVSAREFLQARLTVASGPLVFARYDLLEENRIVLNASAKMLQAISDLQEVCFSERSVVYADKLARFIIGRQKQDGEWNYSEYGSGRIRKQLDFHQGFMIDGLLGYLKAEGNCEMGNDTVVRSVQNAARFYAQRQFTPEGVSLYRYPKLYPTDIHNQAQGIITFSKLAFLESRYYDMARKIALWTITNMQDKTGYFHFRRHRFVQAKIPYLRWGQAWMMLALSTLLRTPEPEEV